MAKDAFFLKFRGLTESCVEGILNCTLNYLFIVFRIAEGSLSCLYMLKYIPRCDL